MENYLSILEKKPIVKKKQSFKARVKARVGIANVLYSEPDEDEMDVEEFQQNIRRKLLDVNNPIIFKPPAREKDLVEFVEEDEEEKVVEKDTEEQEKEEEDIIADEIEEVPKKPRKSKKKTNIRSTITDIKFIKTDKEKKVKVRNVLNQYVEVDPKQVKIDGKALLERLPKDQPNVNLVNSFYYMNNRDIFINFINTLFKPYRQQILSQTEIPSCERREGEFSLMLHQQIIRDYLNLYTPYRGLLLFHGLGAGKTCGSIGIAEGLKTSQQVIVMTPASLRANYIKELKKCGETLYKLNQYWEFIETRGKEDLEQSLSSILNLSVDYIKQNKGAWLVDINKKSNIDKLSQDEMESLNSQINMMIQHKYKFINYNGLQKKDLYTSFGETEDKKGKKVNVFDNKVVIIDEAHNFVSRIVNKIKKPDSLSMVLYDKLKKAENARIIFLTGTPIINYPNELGVLYNILRGNIKTYEIKLNVKSKDKVDQKYFEKLFHDERFSTIDYIEYIPNLKILKITKNPHGFINNYTLNNYSGVKKLNKMDQESYVKWFNRVKFLLKDKNIEIESYNIKNYELLPSRLDTFKNEFINDDDTVKNSNKLKRRILGLTSYFRSPSEELMPKFDKATDVIIDNIEMSDYQFKVYENIRRKERTKEFNNAKKQKLVAQGVDYVNTTSSYRMFSRAFCNFVFPEGLTRPIPGEKSDVKTVLDNGEMDEDVLDGISINERLTNIDGRYDMDDVDKLSKNRLLNSERYKLELDNALKTLKDNAVTYLRKEKLQQYSPKFLRILENLENPDNKGLHLIYTQFRKCEGIEILTLILEQNGFSRFKIKKEDGEWILDMTDEEMAKPSFALYTGSETEEEREYMRLIYNGQWGEIPSSLSTKLATYAENNEMGDIIKVLMITSSGAEGINLMNCRFIHIVEPYWHPVRIDQVIGRGRRICSHQNLPKDMRNMKVFMYLMVFKDSQLKSDYAKQLREKDISKYGENKGKPISSDYSLFEISLRKENINRHLLKCIKESSIDCKLHTLMSNDEELRCYHVGTTTADKFSYKVAVEDDEKDAARQLNVRTKKWKAIPIKGTKFVRKEKTMEVYDGESVKLNKPVKVGKLVKYKDKKSGKMKIKIVFD